MSLLQLLLSLLLSSDLLLLSSANSITLSLSRVAPQTTNPLENLKYHAAASRARANNLIDIHMPLYPRSYGAYSVNLSFGTPPQTLSFEMDTGSDLVWSPCTNHYNCRDCRPLFKNTSTFIPDSSSSYKNLTCQSQHCKWLSPYLLCKNQGKCEYQYTYGSGNTTGPLISDTLAIPRLSVDDFIVGCSVSSYNMELGIVGFGRGRASLPSQLGLTSFSYCMVSHYFDDNTTASSDLVLTRGGNGGRGPAANYTPFISNPAVFPEFYYASLQSISIGGVNVNVPAEYLLPDAKGNGGTIVDSGTIYTMLEQSMFDSVLKELNKQVGQIYEREKQIENETGLELCYNVKNNDTSLPQFTFHFQGNTEMVLPFENYFTYVEESVVCMTIMNNGKVERGPATVVGNYQQQDFYMEYDLENNRLGILPQECG